MTGHEPQLQACAAPDCEHHWVSHLYGGMSVRTCSLCRQPDWKYEREKATKGLTSASTLGAAPAYVLIRRRGGWSISCANCGGYHVHRNPDAIDTIEEILELHGCGEPPL